MHLKKIFHEYQGLIVSVGILVISGFGLLVGVVPLMQKAIDVNDECSTLSGDVNVLNNKISVLETVNEDSMRSDLQTLLSAVPSDKSFLTLLGTLDGLTAKSGVSMGALSLTKPGSLSTASAERLTADEQAVGSNILPFTVNISGTFDQVHAFMTLATSIRRLFRVRTFDISFVGPDSALATVDMDAFYSPLPSTIGSAHQLLTALTSSDTDLIAKVAAMDLLVTAATPLPPPSAGAAKPDPFSL
jgi:Tfp pilus assembly protein PilO